MSTTKSDKKCINGVSYNDMKPDNIIFFFPFHDPHSGAVTACRVHARGRSHICEGKIFHICLYLQFCLFCLCGSICNIFYLYNLVCLAVVRVLLAFSVFIIMFILLFCRHTWHFLTFVFWCQLYLIIEFCFTLF